MTKNIATPLDENTRRYYLDVMGVQCWQSLESVATPSPGEQSAQESMQQPAVEPAVQKTEQQQAEPMHERATTVADWPALEQDVQNCDRCVLHQTRRQALTGRGKQTAELMFVLLAPDAGDDRNGKLCSAAADDLFTKMLAAIDIDINDVYITSLLKCALPASHTVSPKEIHSCTEFLKRQVALVQPQLIVVLGETAMRCLQEKDLSIDDFRAMNPAKDRNEPTGRFESIPVFASYSPQELLQQQEDKRKAWADLQQLQAMMPVGRD